MSAHEKEHQKGRIVEIRSLCLKAGARDRFHRRHEAEIMPMLTRWAFDVVAYGPSLHDPESFYVIRSFADVEERERLEDAFYGSDEWRRSPREAVLADIESYTDVVLPVDETTLAGLRRARLFPR